LPLRQANILLNYFGFGGGCTCSVVSNASPASTSSRLVHPKK
jgi:hypothetical protein